MGTSPSSLCSSSSSSAHRVPKRQTTEESALSPKRQAVIPIAAPSWAGDQFISRSSAASSQVEEVPLDDQLLFAMMSNEVYKVENAICKGESVKMEQNYFDPLHYAAKYNNSEITALLLEYGAVEDINKKDKAGKAPLEYALPLVTKQGK